MLLYTNIAIDNNKEQDLFNSMKAEHVLCRESGMEKTKFGVMVQIVYCMLVYSPLAQKKKKKKFCGISQGN